ncbi:hypothetical protein ElyMa_001262600, partial [Elysia marginata]
MACSDEIDSHGETDMPTYKYIGEYQLALNGFSMAAQLDPSWAEAKTKETELL